MPTIISPADFTVDNQLPNISLQGNDIQAYINQYEPDFLAQLMQADLYAAYTESPTDARFVTLLATPNFKTAIVCYVYWFYQYANGVSITMTTGQGQQKKQNATTVSPYPKMVYSWNKMVCYNKATNKYLKDNATLYPEYQPICFPEWWFAFDGFGWFYPSFDMGWYYGFGAKQLPEIYRVRNSLGV
jgi:hypothetical protein